MVEWSKLMPSWDVGLVTLRRAALLFYRIATGRSVKPAVAPFILLTLAM